MTDARAAWQLRHQSAAHAQAAQAQAAHTQAAHAHAARAAAVQAAAAHGAFSAAAAGQLPYAAAPNGHAQPLAPQLQQLTGVVPQPVGGACAVHQQSGPPCACVAPAGASPQAVADATCHYAAAVASLPPAQQLSASQLAAMPTALEGHALPVSHPQQSSAEVARVPVQVSGQAVPVASQPQAPPQAPTPPPQAPTPPTTLTTAPTTESLAPPPVQPAT